MGWGNDAQGMAPGKVLQVGFPSLKGLDILYFDTK